MAQAMGYGVGVMSQIIEHSADELKARERNATQRQRKGEALRNPGGWWLVMISGGG